MVPRIAGGGAALALAGAALLLVPTRSVPVSFAALFLIVLGLALCTPLGLVLAAGWLRPLAARTVGTLGVLATRSVQTSLSRTAPAVAALVVAVSVTVGLGVMIQSFRSTLVRWLEATLQADVYVSVPTRGTAPSGGTLSPELVERFSRHPQVVGHSTYGRTSAHAPWGDLALVVLDLDPRGASAFDFVEGEPRAALAAFRDEGALLVSDPLAFRHDLGVGSGVTLRTERGTRDFPVAGVFTDYGSDRGVAMIARSTFDAHWSDDGVTSLGLFLRDDADADAVAEELRSGLAAGGGTVSVRSNRTLRTASLEVFDRTFRVTAVLRLLALVVAFIGVLGALMALELERARELGVLRAHGLTPGQLWGLVSAQTGLLGLVSGVLAIPVGLVLASVMIHVVNRRSFGWTLDMELGPEVPAQAVALALAGALLAGLLPAWRMSRTPPAVALREE